jgi:presqualene diphosphate synthase
MTACKAAMRSAEEAPPAATARGSSFYAAMRIMPPRERSAMYEIYGFCRAIDDIADEAGEFARKIAQLEEWRGNVALLYAGTTRPALQGLARAMEEFGLRKEDFLAVIDGMEMDVRGPIVAPDMAMLTLYCDRVACAVGRLSVRVFGMEEREGLDLSHHLGLALQLTNILRDIDEDALLGRLYLPKELLEDAGIREALPEQAIARPAVESACITLAEKARGHFSEADAVMKRCERKRVRTPRVMSQAYQTILAALMERGFAPPRRPVHLSKIRLGYILARNILF